MPSPPSSSDEKTAKNHKAEEGVDVKADTVEDDGKTDEAVELYEGGSSDDDWEPQNDEDEKND